MMGPLPQLYKIIIVVLAVGLSLGAGLWLAGYVVLPLGGIGVGLAGGALLAFLATRDFTHRRLR
ncbi:hypothetical protein [Nocardioides coralli]|uniref:hypothetical protein n=1 Tax=Nocardioides coralli TaxID=2872154 RepID=UPI001CA41D37|nr:hypothetical protein [Nocardioides coralli]QZY28060.1 hypothetical protein K6T13_11210 [Nocardioides coralli]